MVGERQTGHTGRAYLAEFYWGKKERELREASWEEKERRGKEKCRE